MLVQLHRTLLVATYWIFRSTLWANVEYFWMTLDHAGLKIKYMNIRPRSNGFNMQHPAKLFNYRATRCICFTVPKDEIFVFFVIL